MYDPNTDGFYYREPPQKMVFDGKRMRKPIQRKTVDYNCPMVEYLENRVYLRDHRDYPSIQPSNSYLTDLMPPIAYEENPATSIGTHFVHTSTNKVRGPVNQVLWTPEGRRLVTGSFSGEFTLWNGLTFNFETILQAHDTAVRTMVWSHNENFMISGDTGGYIKYWQPNMNNVKAFRAHEEAIRGLSFSPTDAKFVSCSDDVKIKIWDFLRGEQEQVLEGHGWDVKSVSWHPFKSLIVSGSKDNLVKVWDAKSGKNVATIHGHKNTVLKVACNDNGNWFVSASRDCMLRLFDIRMMKELQVFRGHEKEVNSVAWHPFHEGMFASGGFDGSIMFWVVGSEKPQAEIKNAHENSVWSLDWHPLGHILCSGSNDHTTKFWCRNRPGDPMTDRYNAASLPAGKAEAAAAALANGMDVEDEAEGQMSLPGLGGSTDDLGFDGLPDDQPPPSYRDGRGGSDRGGRGGPPMGGGRRDEFGRARDGGRDDFGRERRGGFGGGDREPRGYDRDRDRGGYDRDRGGPGGDRGRRGPPMGGPSGGGGGGGGNAPYRSAPPPGAAAAAKQPYNPFAQYGGGGGGGPPPSGGAPQPQPYSGGGGPPPGGAPPAVPHPYGGGAPPPSGGYGGAPAPGGYAPPPQQRPPAPYGMHPGGMPPQPGAPPPPMGYGGPPPPGSGGGYPPPTGMRGMGAPPAVFNVPPPGYGGGQPPPQQQQYRGGPPPPPGQYHQPR